MAMRRFYCSEVLNKDTNKVEYHFKEANKKRHLTFHSQREAISHVKGLGIDAMVWFRQNGQFVSSVKTMKDVKYEKTDDIEIVKFKVSPSKSKKTDTLETKLLDKADNMFLVEETEKSKSAKAAKNTKTTTVSKKGTTATLELEEVLTVEEPMASVAKNEEKEASNDQLVFAEGFFESEKQYKMVMFVGLALFVLFVVMLALIIFSIFLTI